MRGIALGLVACALAACGDNLPPRCAVSTGAMPRVEDISADGGFVAFSTMSMATRNLFIADEACGAPIPVPIAGGISTLVPTSFCGRALLVFRGVAQDVDYADALEVWLPERTRTLFSDVDPGATRCARNGRYFTTEANESAVEGTELYVVDTEYLVPQHLLTESSARARFTRDSTLLVYSGASTGGHLMELASRATSTFLPDARGRWDLAPDGTAIVYSPAPATLASHPLGPGSDVVLSRDLAAYDIEVSKDSQLVAFRHAPDQALYVVPVEGGVEKPLDGGAVDPIVEHYEDFVLYYKNATLSAVSSSGGEPERFMNGFIIEDDRSDALLLSRDGEIVLVRSNKLRGVPIGYGSQAAFTDDGRVVVQRSSTDGAIDIVESDGTIREVVPRSTGRFVVSRDNWLAVMDIDDGAPTLLRVPF